MTLTIKKLTIISLLIACFCFVNCKKTNDPLNIVLYDKPLSVIQANIEGKWKLQYTYGGFLVSKYPAKHNSYIILKPAHIVIGNDSAGVVVDAEIRWQRAKNYFNDSTYLLTYSYTPGYAFPYMYIVDRIKSDTLILIDNASDPFYYFYTKNNQ